MKPEGLQCLEDGFNVLEGISLLQLSSRILISRDSFAAHYNFIGTGKNSHNWVPTSTIVLRNFIWGFPKLGVLLGSPYEQEYSHGFPYVAKFPYSSTLKQDRLNPKP